MNMREDLKAFVDNELPEERRAEILRALENNPELQAEVIELRQMSRVVREEAWQPAPVGLEKTLAALETAKRRTPWWLDPKVGMTLAVASAVAVCAIIFFPVFAQAKSAAKSLSFSFAKSDENAAAGAAASPDDSKKEMQRSMNGAINGDYSPAGAAFKESRTPAAPNTKTPVVKPQTPATGRPPNVSQAPPQIGTTLNVFAGAPMPEKKANIGLVVESVPQARKRAEAIVKEVGGRVETSSQPTGKASQMTLHVPMEDFEDSITRLRGIGRVSTDSVTHDDLTSQLRDTDGQLANLRKKEDEMRRTDAPAAKKELPKIRKQIESLKATRGVILQAQPPESTIDLSFVEQPATRQPGPSLWDNLRQKASYIPFALPFIFPALLIAWLIAKKVSRHRRET